jgi:sarcosine oxidase subunit gamma
MASTSQKPTILPGRTALYGKTATMLPNPKGGKPGMVFCEMAHLGKLNMRGDKSLGKVIKSITGCTFPPTANKFTTAGERHVVWLGPDEFMVICEAGKDEELASAIHASFSNRHAAVTNITDAFAALHLKGEAVRQVLAKGCALDLHQNSFASGDAAQTLLSHAAATIMALANDEFIVICRTSFASYLHDWIVDAALEYGVKFNK